MTFKNITTAIVLSIALLSCLSVEASSQNLPGQDEKALRVYTLAREAGEIAGHAMFCKADPDAIESYTIKIQARIGVEARDEFDRISARVLFRNIRDAKSGLEPQSGCEKFLPLFEAAVKAAQSRQSDS